MFKRTLEEAKSVQNNFRGAKIIQKNFRRRKKCPK